MLKQWGKWVVVWRVGLQVVVLVALWWLPARRAFEFTRIEAFLGLPAWARPLSVWANFDGIHYLRNAVEHWLLEPRYLPLYPLLVRVSGLGLSTRVGVLQVGLALCVSSLAVVAALIGLARLLRLDYSRQQVGWCLLLFCSFPTAFFLWTAYAESLFLALTVGVLWAARQRRWGWAVAAVAAASMTRLPGILLLIPLVIEWGQHRRTHHLPLLTLRALLAVALAGVPLLLYAGINAWVFGDALKFIHSHGELANGRSTTALVFPLITVWRYVKILESLSPRVIEWWVALLEFASWWGITGGLYALWRTRVRWSYQATAWVLVALPLLSGSFTSLPRYALVAWPLWLPLIRVSKPARWLIVGAGFVLQAVLLALFSQGYFVS